MRIIVAFLAACTVAATIILVYILFEFELFPLTPPSMRLLVLWIAATLGLLFTGAAFIGGVLAIPWLSMYFVFEINRTRRNCMLFGAGCGLISVLALFPVLMRWPEDFDLSRLGIAILVFTFGGILSGLTYWAIAERNQT